MKPYAERFYKSTAWKHCRQSFIRERMGIDGGMCMQCHEQPGYIVHHAIYLTPDNINDQSISLNHANLLYWCKACHDDEHLDNHKSAPLLCRFDDMGRPIDAIT